MSANIEDWITDSKKSLDTPNKNFPSCDENCVCENGTTATYALTDGLKPLEEDKSYLNETPCRRGHSNKRHSFFAGLRYKYFKPHVDTEDLARNTPRKLEGFFHKVLHVQKKHVFDGRKKSRSKTYDVGDDRPKLRSFRMFSTHKEKSASDAHNMDKKELKDCVKPNGFDDFDMKLAERESATTTPCTKMHTNTNSCYRNSNKEDVPTATTNSTSLNTEHPLMETSCATSDVGNTSRAVSPVCMAEYEETDSTSCRNVDPCLMTWSESSFRRDTKYSQSTDMNGFHDVSTPIPRCFSESDVEALRVTTSDKTRTLTPRQSPSKTRRKRSWNIFSIFHRRAKEKQKT